MKQQQELQLKNKGLKAALITIIGWGMTGIFVRGLSSISPLFIVSLRLTIAFLFYFILILLKGKVTHVIRELNSLNAWKLSFILFLSYVLSTVAFVYAPVGESSLLMTIAPLFVLVFGQLFNQETYTKHQKMGAVLATFGSILIFVPILFTSEAISVQRIFGDLCALTVSILLAIYAIWTRSLFVQEQLPSEWSITLGTFLLGCCLLGGLFLQNQTLVITESTDVLLLLGLGLFSTSIPTYCFVITSKLLSPILTTSLLLLQPVATIIFAYLLIQEEPFFLLGVSTILILYGLKLVLKPIKNTASS